ncbi:MAG TPA: TIR domain-containing protein [bacterium]
MDQLFAYDVFISYSHLDKDIVHPLVFRLKQDGVRVWMDDLEIQPGDSIPSRVQEGIQTSRVLLLFMSRNALESKYVEMERASAQFRDPINNDRRFVPVRLDNCTIPDTLSHYLYVDWRLNSEEQYGKLLAASRCAPDLDLDGEERAPVAESVLTGHKGTVLCVSMTPNGRWAVSGGKDRTVRSWDLVHRISTGVLQGHADDILSVVITKDGRRAVSGSADGTVRVWDLESRRSQVLYKGQCPVSSISATPSGDRVLTGDAEGMIRLWHLDADPPKAMLNLGPCKSWVWTLAMSADACWAVSGGRERDAHVWDLRKAKHMKVLKGHSSWIWSVALTANGGTAVTGSADRLIRCWDMRTGTCVKALKEHTSDVLGVATTASGSGVVSGSADRTVRFWNPQGSLGPKSRVGHTAEITSVALAERQGAHLAVSASRDGTLRVWNANTTGMSTPDPQGTDLER